MAQMRKLAVKKPSIKEALLDAVSPVKITLAGITQRLELKGKQFLAGASAAEADISEVWSCHQQIDPEFVLCLQTKSHARNSHKNFKHFSSTVAESVIIFFDIKKCGDSACTICKPPRLPSDMFAKVHHFPDPMPGEEGHYKKFDEVFETSTVEDHRPSLQKITTKQLPFYPSVQHVRNCKTMLLCDECG